MKQFLGVRQIVCLGFAFASCFVWRGADAAVKDDYYRLYDFLFNSNYYKKQIRPAQNQFDAMVVSMTFNLLALSDVDERQQMLVTSARLEMEWDDDYLSWDSGTYGNITSLLVPQENLYLPDVVLSNSVKAQHRIGYDELPVRLWSTGIIQWQPTLLLYTECDIDITYFPFETQKCLIDFETAVSKSNEIDIDIYRGTSAIALGDFSENGQWELKETKAENLANEQDKTKIRFTVIIKRRRTFYLMNIILPVFFLSLTASLVFALPADEGEKMGTGITILLAFAVYLSIVSDIVPNTSLQVSILGLYLTILLGLCALSVIICVFVLRIHFRDPESPVGPINTKIFTFFRHILCLAKPSQNKVEPTEGDSRPDTREKKISTGTGFDAMSTRHKSELGEEGVGVVVRTPSPRPSIQSQVEEPMTWQLVAHTLDFICFILFSLATILTTLICLLYLHFGSLDNAPTLSSEE